MATAGAKYLLKSLLGGWIEINWPELAKGFSICSSLLLCVYWTCMYLDLTANIFGRKLVYVATDLRNSIEPVPTDTEPITLDRQRDTVTILCVSK